MNSGRIADKLDDLLNPIVVKELRQAVKSRIVISALVLFLLIQLSILLLNLSFGGRSTIEPFNLYAGRDIFLILQAILLGTCMFLIPAYAGVRLAAERSDTNVDLLFISTLRPRSIIVGKLQASVVLILLIFSACAPFMTFTYLLRGIDIPSIVLVLALDFLVVVLSTQAAIFLGSVPANLGLKLLLGWVGLGLMVALCYLTVEFSSSLLNYGLAMPLDTFDFWLYAGSVGLAVLATIGLLFIWSVAIVSPPSANRALPVRLYVVIFWLVTGGVAASLTHRSHSPIPLYFWEWAILTLLCAQLVVSINEREQWGLRIKRTIPRQWWLRGIMFLLYSGSAGGVLFAMLFLALTIALPSLALEFNSAFFWSSPGSFLLAAHHRNTLALVLVALYAFDYCMLAVWLRNLLHGRIKAEFTWVLALLLVGLGTSLPWPLLFLFQGEELRHGQVDPWWQISNPLSTMYACVFEPSGKAEGFRDLCLVFLGGMGLLLFLMCLRWMALQVRRFQPPGKETHSPASGDSYAPSALSPGA
ncbi:MAG TPA: hypothetical protein VH592_23345 [Gemmataceae bacterium]|jgi:hypothetical protein